MNIKRILILSLLFCSVQKVKAQKIELLIDSIPGVYAVQLTERNASELFMVRSQLLDGSSSAIVVSRKMGPVIVDLDSLILPLYSPSALRISDVFFYGNRLYIIGPMVISKSGSFFNGAMYWDAMGFHSARNLDSDTLAVFGNLAGTVANGRVYFAPNPRQDSIESKGIVSWDSGFASFTYELPQIKSYRSIKSAGDTLYVLGRTSINPTDQKIYRVFNSIILDSFNWSGCDSSSVLLQTGNIIQYKEGTDTLRMYSSAGPITRQLPYSSCEIQDFARHKGIFYIMGQNQLTSIDPGNQFKSHEYQIRKNLGWRSADLLSSQENLYVAGISFNNSLYVGKVHVGEVLEIRGNVYFDLNSNCQRDTNDRIRDIYMGLVNSPYGARVRPSGAFQIFVPEDGPFTLRPAYRAHEGVGCTNDSLVIEGLDPDSTYTVDMVLSFDATAKDYAVDLNSGTARRGELMDIVVSFENITGNYFDSTSLFVKLDERLEIIDYPPGFNLADHQFHYQNGELGMTARSSFTITVMLDTSMLKVGDSLLLSCWISDDDDLDSNNQDELRVLVLGPLDPNQKSSFPMGPIQSFTRSIDYTIEFQNVGISYANKVVVVDSIDPRMPLKAIRMTGTSHPDDYQLIVRNNVLIWVFEGIYLPDSGTDLHGSKGFISFQAELKEELPFGQKVRNKAYIYFDYEYPVITNTVELYRAQDTIDPPGDPIDLPELYIFPNPARLSIEVYSNSARDQYVEIIDMNGKVVDGFIIEAESKKQIPVLQLSNGVYYLRTEEGRVGRFIKY